MKKLLNVGLLIAVAVLFLPALAGAANYTGLFECSGATVSDAITASWLITPNGQGRYASGRQVAVEDVGCVCTWTLDTSLSTYLKTTNQGTETLIWGNVVDACSGFCSGGYTQTVFFTIKQDGSQTLFADENLADVGAPGHGNCIK